MVRCLRTKLLRPTRFLDIKVNKKGGGVVEGQISYNAIKADRKWKGVRTPNLHLGIKANKNWDEVLETFLPISLSLQEKVPK